MKRGSIIGPLILIGIGVLFLLRNVWPDIPVLDYLARYWPFLLIAWGVIRLLEVLLLAIQSKPLPREGISGGEWVLVLIICLVGASMYAVHNRGSWFPTLRGWRGFVMDLGQSYEFQLPSAHKPCPKNCRVLIEGFQGNARISGGASDGLVIAAGKETVRSFNQTEAEQVSKQTSLEMVQQGSQIIVRANQGLEIGRPGVSTELDLSVPADASIQAEGRFGDFNIGNVSAVELRGRGQHLELDNISGPVMVEDPRISLRCASVPGEMRITSGDFTANNITGPVVLNGRSRDVRISGFTQSLELTLQRGDVVLTPGNAVPQIAVHTSSGNIDLALPEGAKLDLKASTRRGEVHNEYGAPLTVNASRRGGEIVGNVGGGPPVVLETDRGAINVSMAHPSLPSSLDQPLHVERQ